MQSVQFLTSRDCDTRNRQARHGLPASFQALADNQIRDSEFQLIMAEFSQYNVLKEAVRAKLTRNSSQPVIQKITKKNVRSEIEEEYRKKKNKVVAGSKKLLKIHGFICISLKHDCLFPLNHVSCQ